MTTLQWIIHLAIIVSMNVTHIVFLIIVIKTRSTMAAKNNATLFKDLYPGDIKWFYIAKHKTFTCSIFFILLIQTGFFLLSWRPSVGFLNSFFPEKVHKFCMQTQFCLIFGDWDFCKIKLLSKPQLNHNSTQPNITLSWVRHENDFAHHPTLTSLT